RQDGRFGVESLLAWSVHTGTNHPKMARLRPGLRPSGPHRSGRHLRARRVTFDEIRELASGRREMKKLLLVGALLLSAAPVTAQDHTDVVQAVKADLVARGVNISGPCGAFQITGRVAWILRNEGWGLL